MATSRGVSYFLKPIAIILADAVPMSIALALRSIHFSLGQPVLTQLAMRMLRLKNWKALPERFPIPDAPHLTMARSDSVVCAIVFWLGQRAYEGSEIDWWAACCTRSRNVVEVGANVGLYSLNGAAAVPADARYLAIEPHPVSYAVLKASLSANHFNQITCMQVAAIAGTDEGEVELHIPAQDRYGAPAGAHVVGQSPIYAPSAQSNTAMLVKAIPFRNIIAQADLIKIDVEGLEADLLNSAIDIIIQHRPTIFIEVLDQNQPLKNLITQWQAEKIYNVFRILPEGIAPVAINQHARSFGGDLRDVILSGMTIEQMRAIFDQARLVVP